MWFLTIPSLLNAFTTGYFEVLKITSYLVTASGIISPFLSAFCKNTSNSLNSLSSISARAVSLWMEVNVLQLMHTNTAAKRRNANTLEVPIFFRFCLAFFHKTRKDLGKQRLLPTGRGIHVVLYSVILFRTPVISSRPRVDFVLYIIAWRFCCQLSFFGRCFRLTTVCLCCRFAS